MSSYSAFVKKHRYAVVGALLAVGATVVALILHWDGLVSFFGNTDRLKQSVQQAGLLGPLVFMAIQFLQIVVAPIPGQAVGLIAGALFGPWLGTLYAMIGATIGFTTIFVLAKLLGRPFVERFVKKDDLLKFDKITKKAGPLVLFLIFLLPGFPDDVICYLAGLSDLKISTLVLVSLAGRLPGYLITSFMGAGVGDANGFMIATVSAITGLALVAAYIYRKPLKAWIDRLLEDDPSLKP